MIAKPPRQHVRREVGGLPIMRMVARRMGLAALFERFVRSHGNDLVPIVDTLMLLVYNLTGGKEPL